jgi:hypothetical protein
VGFKADPGAAAAAAAAEMHLSSAGGDARGMGGVLGWGAAPSELLLLRTVFIPMGKNVTGHCGVLLTFPAELRHRPPPDLDQRYRSCL